MNLQELQNRKNYLQESLNSIQQSFHVVTGHMNEVDFQIKKIVEAEEALENQVEAIVE
jgi:prefoldin subunit 5